MHLETSLSYLHWVLWGGVVCLEVESLLHLVLPKPVACGIEDGKGEEERVADTDPRFSAMPRICTG